MKAFEDWWLEKGANFSWHDQGLQESAWKAALEWALSQKEGMDGCETINTEILEEELDE